MSVNFNVKSFASSFNISSYQGGKVKVDGKNLRLSEIAKSVITASSNKEITPEQSSQAYQKLLSMREIHIQKKQNKINNFIKSILKINTNESTKEISKTDKYLQQIEKNGSGIDLAVSDEDRKNYDSLIGKFDAHVDGQFKDCPIPKDQTVMIHVREDNGMGDVMLCIKSMKALREKFPDLNIQISVETRTLKTEDVVNKIQQDGLSLGVKDVFSYDARPSDLPDPSVLMIMPEDPPGHVEDKLQAFKVPPKRLMMKEYGWGEALKSGGLSDASLGIFLDQGLGKLQSTETNSSTLNKLSNQQFRDIIFKNKSPEKYQSENKLYFGYAHMPKSTSGFIKSIVSLNTENHSNLDFYLRTENCIPGVNWKMNVEETGIAFSENKRGKAEKKDEISFELLKQKGIDSIEIIKVKRQEVTKEIAFPDGTRKKVTRLEPMLNEDGSFQIDSSEKVKVPGASGGKSIRILDLFPVSHDDMLKLNQASEPEMLVTGNQSFSEAVSSKKRFFYEVVPNDRNLAAQMKNLGEKVNPSLKDAIGIMQCGDKVMDHEAIAAALKDQKVKDGFDQLGKIVKRDFDLSNRIELKIKRQIFAYNNPEIARHLDTVDHHVEILSQKREDDIEQLREENRHGEANRPIAANPNDFHTLFKETANSLFSIKMILAKQSQKS